VKAQVDSLIAAGLDVEVVHPHPGRRPLLRYISAALQVFFKTLTGTFDIVHGHYGLWCLVARLQWTTPVVASFLGSDLLVDEKFATLFSKKDLLVTRISRWLCHHVNAVNVKSKEMKEAIAGINHVIVYPDGVDFSLFRPMPRAQARATLGWHPERNYILFGNDAQRPEKNFPLAQAAIERLHAKGITAELVVASGLAQNQVVFCINASNVVILSSLYEGSPNIVKEAMACNVPVVATDVGDVAQIIGRTRGCVICSWDPDEVATALEEALHHTEPTTGRSDIAHLERSVIAQQIIVLYEQIVSSRRTARFHHLLGR